MQFGSKIARRASRLMISLALGGAVLAASGCERIAPVRTLPAWVRGIYVPMMHNASYEPGLEDEATRLTQDAFLADGRVDIVQKRDADVSVIVDIIDWKDKTTGTSGDHVATRLEVTMTATLKLFDPGDPKEPLADLGKIVVVSGFDTDARSTLYENEPDRRTKLLKQFAQQIVNMTITGFPASIRNAPPGTVLPTINTDANQVHQSDILKERTTQDR